MPVSIEDRLAIDDLITGYAVAIDEFDIDALLALVTEDVVLEGSISGHFVGIDGLHAWFRLGDQIEGVSRHLVTNVRVRAIDEPSAVVTAHFVHLLTAPPADTASSPVTRVRATGQYEFALRRTGDGWKLSRRTAIIDGFEQQPAAEPST